MKRGDTPPRRQQWRCFCDLCGGEEALPAEYGRPRAFPHELMHERPEDERARRRKLARIAAQEAEYRKTFGD